MFGWSEHPQVVGIPAPGERDVELAVREDVLLDVDADPEERKFLCLVDGPREGDADGELPPLELKGAHVVRREHLGDGDFLALLGPVEDPGEDRVPQQPGDHRPGDVRIAVLVRNASFAFPCSHVSIDHLDVLGPLLARIPRVPQAAAT